MHCLGSHGETGQEWEAVPHRLAHGWFLLIFDSMQENIPQIWEYMMPSVTLASNCHLFWFQHITGHHQMMFNISPFLILFFGVWIEVAQSSHWSWSQILVPDKLMQQGEVRSSLSLSSGCSKYGQGKEQPVWAHCQPTGLPGRTSKQMQILSVITDLRCHACLVSRKKRR